MNDFLTRMAQFSRGEAMVVTPRLPSLFAPTEETDTPQTNEAHFQQMSKKNLDPKGPSVSTRAVVNTGQPQPPAATDPTADHLIWHIPETEQADEEEMNPAPLITQPGNSNGNERTTAPVITNMEDRTEIQHRGRRKSNPTPSPLNDEPQSLKKTVHIETSFESVTGIHGQQESNREKLSQPLVPDRTSKQTTHRQAMAELPTATQLET
ncbi:MAG: hypothetical protein GY732_11600, partial [Gammaproteobacteria bacterium]|nr:hypothetical protein [Gammaproteobacteria bacterium]